MREENRSQKFCDLLYRNRAIKAAQLFQSCDDPPSQARARGHEHRLPHKENAGAQIKGFDARMAHRLHSLSCVVPPLTRELAAR